MASEKESKLWDTKTPINFENMEDANWYANFQKLVEDYGPESYYVLAYQWNRTERLNAGSEMQVGALHVLCMYRLSTDYGVEHVVLHPDEADHDVIRDWLFKKQLPKF